MTTATGMPTTVDPTVVAERQRPASVSVADDTWPRTTRLLPWMLAGFVTLLFLVPVDSIRAPVPLPVDSSLDRLFLIAVVGLYVFALAARAPGAVRLRSMPLARPLLLFVAVAGLSVLLNLPELQRLDEVGLAVKKLSLLVAYGLVFYIVATVVRAREVNAFLVLIVVLGTVTALGTIAEFRTGTNFFFSVSGGLLPGAFTVTPPPETAAFNRPAITGPTVHGLAVASILSFSFACAISLALLGTVTRRRRILATLASLIILVGALVTLRKTAVIAPLAVIVSLVALRPRHVVTLLPLVVALFASAALLAPGVLGSLVGQVTDPSSEIQASTAGRTSDYAALLPDVVNRPLVGRGYGTYEPDQYRILDNQFLLLLVTVGAIGLLVYLILLLRVVRLGWLVSRSDSRNTWIAYAAVASCGSFFVVQLLFDSLSFPQVPYVFFFILGLLVVAASREAVGNGRLESSTTCSADRSAPS